MFPSGKFFDSHTVNTSHPQETTILLLPFHWDIFDFSFFLFKLHTVKLKVLNLFCFVF